MWATQLRNYNLHSEKSSRNQPKRGLGTCDNNNQQSQSDADSTAEGGNSSENQSQTSNKNLDKCAQLLSDMLRQDPGIKMRQARESKTAKTGPGMTKARRIGKPALVMKTKRINDRGTKPAVVKKQVTIKAKNVGKKENAIDSVSETSTELQVRLAGPKPIPLNNSETVIQVVGKEPEPVPKLNSGHVVMTKVPYNERILCSTPMSSPNPKSLHNSHSLHHSNHSYNQGYFHTDGAHLSRKTLPGPQLGYSLHSSTKSDGPLTGPAPVNQQQLKPAEQRETLAAMENYIASTDDHLSSFLRNYLSQVQQQPSHPTSAPPLQTPALGSKVLSEMASQRQFIGQAQYPMSTGNEGHFVPYTSLGAAHTAPTFPGQVDPRGASVGMTGLPGHGALYQNLSMTPNIGSHGTSSVSIERQIPDLKPVPSSEVDIDAILRSHGITLKTGSGWVGSASVPPSSTQPDVYPIPGVSGSLPVPNSTGPVMFDPSHGTPVSQNPHPHPADTPNIHQTMKPNPTAATLPEAFTIIPERDITAGEETNNKENQANGDDSETEPKTPRVKKSKSSKKDKEKHKKNSVPKAGTAVPKPSPADVKTQVRTLVYLFGELRAVTSMSKDREVTRLLTDMESILEGLTPGMATSALSTDLDLALQPLRSENAQLRRRIRILSQQFKEKCQVAEEACKPDPNFQVIHLELQRHSLETQLKEECEAKEKIQSAMASLAQQVQSLMKERQQMLQLFNVKDTDHIKSQQDWVGEAGKLRIQLKASEQNLKERQSKLDVANNEVTLLEVTLKQKNKEIDRLRELVKDLQGSMSRLLEELKGSKPRPLQSVDDISHYIQSIDAMLRPEKTKEIQTRPIQEASPTDKKKTSMVTFQSLSSTPTDSSPYSSPLQQLVDAIPDVPTLRDESVEGGLERAYRLLDRIDAAITPEVVQVSQSHSHSTPEQHTGSPQRPKPARNAWENPPESPVFKHSQELMRKTQEKGEGGRRSSPRKGPSVRATGFDPENDDYQGKLTQELLMEHDRQNGVDDEVIERMLVRSTPGQRPGERREAKGRTHHQTSDAQVKTRSKDAQQRVGSESDFDKQSGLTGIYSRGDLDTTEYLTPPTQKALHAATTGPTVKELLAPIANRMMNSTAPKRVNVYEETTSELTSGTLSTESEFGGEGDVAEGDSTLTLVEDKEEDQVQIKPAAKEDKDVSRYSLTDYFKKYPQNRQSLEPSSAPIPKPQSQALARTKGSEKTTQHLPHSRSGPSEGKVHFLKAFDEKPLSPMSFVSTTVSESPADLTDLSKLSFSLTSSSESPSEESPPEQSITISQGLPQTSERNPPPQEIPQSRRNLPAQGIPPTQVSPPSEGNPPKERNSQGVSPQDNLYKGTELDTSLSTIQEAESNSVLTASTITSLSTLSSVDEVNFKHGLAQLDANIARLQESLKQSTKGSR